MAETWEIVDLCVPITPFGKPVVPEVKEYVKWV